jgi:hypothetical protein
MRLAGSGRRNPASRVNGNSMNYPFLNMMLPVIAPCRATRTGGELKISSNFKLDRQRQSRVLLCRLPIERQIAELRNQRALPVGAGLGEDPFEQELG